MSRILVSMSEISDFSKLLVHCLLTVVYGQRKLYFGLSIHIINCLFRHIQFFLNVRMKLIKFAESNNNIMKKLLNLLKVTSEI